MYPGFIVPFRTMIFAINSYTSFGGSSKLPQTQPFFKSRIETPFVQNPTISPGFPSRTFSWCCQMDMTSHLIPEGAKQTFMPGLSTPELILPIATVPTPPILYIFRIGSRRGPSVGLAIGALIRSTAQSKVGPLYQDVLQDFFTILSPRQPEVGTNITFSGLYPTFQTYFSISAFTWLYRSYEQLTDFSSILLRQTISCLTPKVKAKSTCQRVWPSSMPASYYPSGSPTTRKAHSAWNIPDIIFLMKSLWPGASMMVQ